jgi:multiple sugar transport system substrate-binding protein
MKKVRSPFFVVTSIVLLGGLILSACAPAATPAPTTAPTQPPAPTAVPATEVPVSAIKGTIRVGSWDNGPGLEPWNKAIESFKAANPEVTVQFEPVPTDYGTKLLTQFAAGTAPDVFQVGDGDVSNFAAQGVLEPLDPFISGDNPLDMSVFFPGVAAIGKVGDKTYLLTKDYSPLVLYYNKTLFDAASVAYPTDSWTWDDMLAAAKKLTDPAKTQWGLMIPDSWGDPLWTRGIQPIIHQNGGSIISDDGKTTTGHLNSPATVAALQWYVDLFLKYKVSPTKGDVESLAGTDLFQNGNAAMLWTGRWPLGDFKKNADLKFGTVELPMGTQRANSICWAGFAIYSKSPNKATAWAFLKHIAAGEGAKAFADYALTAVQPIADSQGLANDPFDAPIVKDLENIKPLPEFTTAKYGDCVDKFFKENLEKVLLQGLGVQEAMDTAAQQADACLAAAAQ